MTKVFNIQLIINDAPSKQSFMSLDPTNKVERFEGKVHWNKN